ncbi:MAG: O-antigen ligase family protein [Okeania sp. SIO2F4]|uniref:O-antigen ligase family protein n=1 Tax=Okeania sp. SIO2F4 TaxID=2607790 RepID=UPI00142AA235|nr:O-antigen ligase family protein [Okeania sp. SIO2F4]NES07070.1 O-antigen ligase family protein [Okeania sp. SIO2F4]
MKELLKNPIILLPILGCGVIYLLLAFLAVSRNQKLGALAEKLVVGLYLFMMPGLGVAPFPTFHPTALAHPEKSLPSMIVQLGLYGALLFILSPRLKYTLKYYFDLLALLLQKNPGLCLFLFLILLSFGWSDTPVYTLKYSIVLLATTVFDIYIIKQYSYKEISTLLKWSLVVTAILSTFYSKFKPAIGINVVKNSWQGIINHPNPLAALMALSAILWGLEAIENSQNRWLSIGMVFYSLFVLQMAKSGGGQVQFLIGTVIIVSVRFLKQLPFQWSLFFVVVFLILSISGFIIITNNLEAIVVDALGKDLTLTGRTPIWAYLFAEKIPKRPLLGYGFHGFWQPWRGADNPAANHISGELRMPSGSGYWTPPHSHNGFVEIILDFGFIGFAAFALSFITALVQSIQYLTRPQQRESVIELVLPILLLIFVIFPNLTERPLVENNNNWYYYIFTTVGISIKTYGKNFRAEPKSKKN